MDLGLFLFACISTLILFSSLTLIQKIFFKLAIASSSLLNVLIDKELNEDEKQKGLLKNLVPTVLLLVLFTLFIYLTFVLFFIPFIIWKNDVNNFDIPSETFQSIESWIALSLGSFIFFWIQNRKKGDYSEWSKLLHRIILNNPNIPKRLIRKKTDNIERKKVIVSGLARAGTTALTNDLHSSGNFDSLSYASMPFLLAPKFGLKINRKKTKDKERAHSDSIMVNSHSIEALEDYFFKVELKNQFIQEDRLAPFTVDHSLKSSYDKYISQICSEEKTYLAKNNNFILRAKSHLDIDKDLKAIFIIREPLDHAKSLLKQHLNFSEIQSKDPFVLEYMNWLVHHEFGLKQLAFDFGKSDLLEKHSKTEINYWLISWLNYYEYAKSLKSSNQVLFIRYEDYLNNRESTLKRIEQFTQKPLNLDQLGKFKGKQNKIDVKVYKDLLGQCIKLYEEFA